MRQLISTAIATLAVAAFSTLAVAQQANGDKPADTNGSAALTFDLGVDISGVPASPVDAKRFLSTLSEDGQRIMLTTCARYVENPATAQQADTIQFCKNLLS